MECNCVCLNFKKKLVALQLAHFLLICGESDRNSPLNVTLGFLSLFIFVAGEVGAGKPVLRQTAAICSAVNCNPSQRLPVTGQIYVRREKCAKRAFSHVMAQCFLMLFS